MFNKKNDPLINSVKAVMEQNEIHRRVEAAVNEHFGVESKAALPHELHAEYDAVLAEAKRCSIEESEDKPESPDHHRAMAIRAHKAIKAGDKSEITANKKKRHEKAYKEMTGNKIKYPDSVNEENDEGSTPRNAKERALAKLHGNPKKITHGDVLKGRGVVEESEQIEEKATESQKDKVGKIMGEFKRGKLHSGSKKGPVVKNKEQAIAIALNQAGLSKKKLEEEMDIDLIMEEIYTNLLEELNYVYENYDEASFADYVNSLTEEQLEVLGLNEQTPPMGATRYHRTQAQASAAKSADKGGTGHMGDRNAATGRSNVPAPAPTNSMMGQGGQNSSFRAQPTMGSSANIQQSGPKPAILRSQSKMGSSANIPQASSVPAAPNMSLGRTADAPTGPKLSGGLRAQGGISASAGHGGGRKLPDSTQQLRDVLNSRREQRPSNRSAARPSAKPAARPAARPTARPTARPAAKKTSAAQDFMGNFQREESEIPTQIKESFEQFLRNRFLRG